MSVTLLINENQKRVILKESIKDEFSDSLKQNYDFVKDIIKMSSEQIGINLQFLVTWGASIGGFVGPLNDFIAGKFPTMSDVEVSLLLTGIISMYYIDNKELVNQIMDSIKERGLSNEFKVISKKADQLHSTFVSFIKSLNMSLHKITNILSYAFIIPLIPMIYEAVSNGAFKHGDGSEIGIRLASFGVLTLSGILIRELINKLIRRFSNHR
jgi:hypothetical protein